MRAREARAGSGRTSREDVSQEWLKFARRVTFALASYQGVQGVERKRGHMRAIAAELPGITAPVLGRHGFAEAQLVTQWASIIGPELAAMAWPEKLSFPRGERREGTLRLRVAAGCAPEIQHRAPLLIERINAFFGYRAIVHLRLIQ